MNAPVQIRKAATVQRLRRLAESEGKTITHLVDEMAAERETRRQAEVERRLKAIEEIVERFNRLPVVGPLLTDDDLYDEDGFPK